VSKSFYVLGYNAVYIALKASRRFGGTYRIHLRNRGTNQHKSRKQPQSRINEASRRYVGVLISLWIFLFAAQPKEFFLDGLKKLERRSYKCVELRGEYVE
jgi:hypothetical protein